MTRANIANAIASIRSMKKIRLCPKGAHDKCDAVRSYIDRDEKALLTLCARAPSRRRRPG